MLPKNPIWLINVYHDYPFKIAILGYTVQLVDYFEEGMMNKFVCEVKWI